MSLPSPSYPPQLDGCFSTSSVDEFSYRRAGGGERPPLALSTVVTGRKTWKTLKEKKEAVWPPLLESALLEALEMYRPTSTRDVRQLQRFPKRNRFISDYIFEATGRRRTAKQVGSRLQQLRDTCSEDRILDLLTRRDILPGPDDPSASDAGGESSSHTNVAELYDDDALTISSTASSSASPALFLSPHHRGELILSADGDIESHSLPSPASPQAYVCIELIPSHTINSIRHDINSSGQLPSFSLDFNGFGIPRNPRPTFNHHIPAQNCTRISIITPDPLWDFIPTVSFTSPHLLSLQDYRSLFCVFLGDMHVHSEATELFQLSSPPSPSGEIGPFVYGTKLIPESWATLCKNTGQDLSSYTVAQDIMLIPVASDSDARDPLVTQDSVVFSVVYNFEHKQPTQPFSTGHLSAYHLPVLRGDPQLPPGFPNTLRQRSSMTPETHHDGLCLPDYARAREEFSSVAWMYSEHGNAYNPSAIPSVPQPEFVPLHAPTPLYPLCPPMHAESGLAPDMQYFSFSHCN